MNPQIGADAVVPARSLIGDNGQPLKSPTSTADTNGSQGPPDPGAEPESGSQNGKPPEQVPSEAVNNNSKVEENGASEQTSDEAEASTLAAANMVYGRDQVMQLVKTLFPHRDMLNGNQNGSDDSS
jgi:carbon dioxide concentrating mechanism protein CcmN